MPHYHHSVTSSPYATINAEIYITYKELPQAFVTNSLPARDKFSRNLKKTEEISLCVGRITIKLHCLTIGQVGGKL